MKRIALTIMGLIAAGMIYLLLVPDFATELERVAMWRSSIPEIAAEEVLLEARQDTMRALLAARERLVALEAARALPITARPYAFSADAALMPATREAFDQRAQSELASIGDSLEYPVRVHLVRDTSMIGGYRRIVVLPRDARDPCAVVVLLSNARQRDVLPKSEDRLIGACGFYAAFGAPGSGMERWLLETRGIMAAADIEMPAQYDGPRHRLTSSEVVVAPEAAACVAGNDDACVTAWEGSSWMRRLANRDSLFPEATRGTVRSFAYSAQNVPGRNLGDLRGAMSDVNFRRLWRSTEEPVVAYETIEGRSIAYFVRDRLLTEVEPHRPGPLHATLPFALGVAIAAGAATLAIRFTKRQRS